MTLRKNLLTKLTTYKLPNRPNLIGIKLERKKKND